MKKIFIGLLLVTSIAHAVINNGGGSSIATPVSLTNGGTNQALTAINGGIVWSDAAKLNLLIAGTSGQVLLSGGAATPTWGSGGTGLTSLNSQVGGTQVFANGTNVVITSSNNTHSLGWSGTLSMALGGTASALVAAGGDVLYSDANKVQLLAAGTSGQIFKSNGASAPAWVAASTVSMTSLNSQTSGTQVFANDANVVVTSSNNTHSLGWASTLSLTRGGTGASLTAAGGDIVYSNSTGMALLAAGTSGQEILSGGSGAPTYGLNMSGLTPAGGDIVYTDANKIQFLKAGTSGQVLSSTGSGAPSWTTAGGGSVPNTWIAVDTSNGVGASTTIVLWTNVVSSGAGSDLSHTSAAADDYITVLTAGNYCVFLSLSQTSNIYIGITKNAATGDPNTGGNYANTLIYNIPVSTIDTVRLGLTTIVGTGSGYNGSMDVCRYFNVNDRIRAQVSGAPNSNSNQQMVVSRMN